MYRKKFVLPLILLALGGCYYDKESVLYPNSANCTEVINPTFSGDVLPLLNSRCNNCHGGTAPSAGINLTTYPSVMKYVNDGSLMGSINQTSGYSAMPKNSGKMPACEINKIQTWITAGALNN
ncbi:MAG TPA: hypothetical protein PKJ83_02040 [Cyclobacteriaceae bacterium]|nr:hypothetical protein [Cyclobacteriaceae bacterium]HPW60966.1 hypothetical protein [Cyclobacteriaceae bacterium]